MVILALITIQVLFGINYVVSKVLVGSFSPLVWASFRIILASVLMFAIAKRFAGPRPKLTWPLIKEMSVYALLGTVINQTCFLIGIRHTTATNSAILNSMIPVFTLLAVTVQGKEKMNLLRGVGFLISFGGVLALRKVENLSITGATWMGDLLTLLNCLSYGIFLSVSKPFFERVDRMWATVYLFSLGSIGITLMAIPEWLTVSWPVMTPTLWGACTFSILGATLLTYFLNFWALSKAKSSQVALFIFLQPVIATFIAWMWMGEVVTLRTLMAGFMIFVGIVCVVKRPKGETSGEARGEQA